MKPKTRPKPQMTMPMHEQQGPAVDAEELLGGEVGEDQLGFAGAGEAGGEQNEGQRDEQR